MIMISGFTQLLGPLVQEWMEIKAGAEAVVHLG